MCAFIHDFLNMYWQCRGSEYAALTYGLLWRRGNWKSTNRKKNEKEKKIKTLFTSLHSPKTKHKIPFNSLQWVEIYVYIRRGVCTSWRAMRPLESRETAAAQLGVLYTLRISSFTLLCAISMFPIPVTRSRTSPSGSYKSVPSVITALEFSFSKRLHLCSTKLTYSSSVCYSLRKKLRKQFPSTSESSLC